MIARFKLQPFIVTLATMGSLRGRLYVYADDAALSRRRDVSRRCSAAPSSARCRSQLPLLRLACPIVWFYLNHTISGRAVYAIGVNKEAVRLAGVDVGRHMIFAYVACGFFAAIAGVLLA